MRLRDIHIKGFKSIVDQTVDLGRVNCFIGANGVGKSNVLEAIGVLGAAAGGRIDDEAIIRRGARGAPKAVQDVVRQRSHSTAHLPGGKRRPGRDLSLVAS